MRRALGFILLGGVGGALFGAVVWAYASRQVDQQISGGAEELTSRLGAGSTELRRRLEAGRRELQTQVRTEVQRQVPPIVRRELDSTLSSYGITRDTGRQIASLLARAESVGILGLGRG